MCPDSTRVCSPRVSIADLRSLAEKMVRSGSVVSQAEGALGEVDGLKHELRIQEVLVQLLHERLQNVEESLDEHRSGNCAPCPELNEALRSAETKFKALFEKGPIGVAYHRMIYDASGKSYDYLFLDANEQYLKLTGVDPRGKTVRQAFPGIEHDSFDWIGTFGRVARTGETIRFEAYLQPNGRWYDVVGYQYQPDHFVAAFLEITERKRAEESLRVSEAKQRAMVSNIADVIAIIDREGINRYKSPNVETWFGWKPEELVGVPTWENVHPDDRSAAQGFFAGLISRPGDHGSGECRYRCRNGEYRWIEFTATNMIDNPIIQGILLNYHDITERKQTQDALRVSEERHRSLLQSIQLGVVVHAPDNRILFANSRASQLLGLSFDQLLGKTAIDEAWCFLREDETRMPLEEYPVNRVLATNAPVTNLILGIHRPDRNSLTWVQCNAHLDHDGEGRLQQVVVSFADITERKRAMEEKEKLTGQLAQAQKMESVGRLAGGVAHDFNNMIGVILGNVDVAMDLVDQGTPLHARLAQIRKAAKRSADLTRQLLAFARKQTVQPKILDLNETVQSLLKMLQQLIGENIRLDWRPGADAGMVKMDPGQVDQILVNLCVNARDAIPDAGSIAIETRKSSFDAAYCSPHDGVLPGEFVVLSVTDDGCGMDQETLSHLFEPFFTTKEVGKGTGLGLATIFGIVKQNHGFIEVESNPGQGTTFRICLPRRQDLQPGIAPTPTETKLPRGSGLILLVEDESELLDMTTLLLKRLGYQVVAAATPFEAIRLAEEHAGGIDLVLTDVILPEMNGQELASRLISRFPNLKIIFMSGYTADVIGQHGVLEEGIHFIPKPFEAHELAEKIRSVLEGNHLG